MNRIIRNSANAWDSVYKELGEVFVEPSKNFTNYLKLLRQKPRNYRILDLGCGTGRHLVRLARKGYDVYGIDYSSTAIEIVKNHIQKESLKAHLDKGDIFEKLPYKNNSFDSVLSIAVVYHSTLWRIRRLFSEVLRVLKPEGIFFFTTSISMEYSRSVNSGSCYVPIEKGTYFPMDGRERFLPHHYFTKEELFEILKDDYKKIKLYNDKENYYVISCVKK